MGSIGPVMLDIESTRLSNEDKTLLKNPLVGGLILFSRNIESAQQVKELTSEIKSINPDILIAVDQEGGRVQRLVDEFSILPALSKFGLIAEKDLEKAKTFCRDIGELMALEVQSVGCDISFAPVLDLGFPTSRVIGDRAFALDPEMVVELGGAYIEGMKKGGMQATGKHFPGHGSVEADSHHEIPFDDRDEQSIRTLDLIPFKSLSNELGAIMPAHVIYESVDDKPAGFSSIWLQQILRKECGFNGVIFSDDLSMKGAETAGDFTERAIAALEGGCDMVLVCNDRKAAQQVLGGLEGRVNSKISSERLAKLKMENAAVGLSKLKTQPRWQTLSDSLGQLVKTISECQED